MGKRNACGTKRQRDKSVVEGSQLHAIHPALLPRTSDDVVREYALYSKRHAFWFGAKRKGSR